MDDKKRLEQRVKDQQASLARERELHKPTPNERMAEDTPDFISSYDFWCEDCDIDFSSEAYKVVHRLYGDPIITYRAECPECGQECVRLVSHRDHDNYYNLSERIISDRNQYAVEVLQHEEFGFETYYENPFKKFDIDLKAKEERIIRMEREKGLKGLSLATQEHLRNIRK